MIELAESERIKKIGIKKTILPIQKRQPKENHVISILYNVYL